MTGGSRDGSRGGDGLRDIDSGRSLSGSSVDDSLSLGDRLGHGDFASAGRMDDRDGGDVRLRDRS